MPEDLDVHEAGVAASGECGTHLRNEEMHLLFQHPAVLGKELEHEVLDAAVGKLADLVDKRGCAIGSERPSNR